MVRGSKQTVCPMHASLIQTLIIVNWPVKGFGKRHSGARLFTKGVFLLVIDLHYLTTQINGPNVWYY